MGRRHKSVNHLRLAEQHGVYHGLAVHTMGDGSSDTHILEKIWSDVILVRIYAEIRVFPSCACHKGRVDLTRSLKLKQQVALVLKLTALIQRRWLELMQGGRPLVDPTGKTDMEVVIQEIVEGKIGIDYEASGLVEPE